jgi:hypothetical protein
LRVLTGGGEVTLWRRYFWSPTGGGYPVDAVLGVAAGRVSAGAREICCRMGLVQDFAQGAADTQRIGGLPMSKERLRQIVEAEAAAVKALRDAGTLPAAWSAEQAAVRPGGPTRVYVGVDGVLVRTVTQAEKERRRKAHVRRRRPRAARGLPNAKALQRAQAGSDQTFKEMKLGVFYDQHKRYRHALVTAGNHVVLGRLLAGYATQIGLACAAETIGLVDGAKWIAARLGEHLRYLQALLLDFYHLSEQVHDTARVCLGDTPAARAWAAARLQEVREHGWRVLLAGIEGLAKTVRAPAKRDRLRRLREYVVERWEMLDYVTALARGWDIGSGPTEALCKSLTLRLKRPGVKWDARHAADLMNLIALYECGQAPRYWASRAA